jgi:hypothetical protein
MATANQLLAWLFTTPFHVSRVAPENVHANFPGLFRVSGSADIRPTGLSADVFRECE